SEGRSVANERPWKLAAKPSVSLRYGHECPRQINVALLVLPSKAMTSLRQRRLRDPLFLLCLAAGLLAFVVQSGELGTADTMHRLQTAHWLWTSQPQVFPNEYPEFGLHGRDGRIFSWYGIGQSLLMLPSDLVGTWISHWRIFNGYEDDPAIRSIFVSFTTNILINVLTALIAFRFLRQLKFGEKESIAGVLALLFCTTHLHYTQNMQENNYIMLLTLAGFSYQYEWLRKGHNKALWLGSAALGLNLLTRVTTGLDVVAAGFFLLAVLWIERVRGKQLRQRAIAYCKVAVPVHIFFGIIERSYNFYRFGSWTQTYIPIFAREQRLQDPTLPMNFPWSTPFHEGVLGALFKPEKSIFLFDPLLLLAFLLLIMLWRRLSPEVRAYAVTALLLLFGYICFYARYTYWAGDFAWGDRYVSTAVEMVAILAAPLLLSYRMNLGKAVWQCGIVLIAASLVIQIASLAFWLPLEIYQMEALGHPTFVIALRFKNIAAFALGKMDAWGLNTEAMSQDQWDYVHITTWNFLPFLLRRVGAAPRWMVDVAFVVWAAALAALATVLLRLTKVLTADAAGE
ncbi:MAG: glycosyltransferase family 39 protein, partial [Candidatus Sulfotelmatobacter sp.]